MKIWTNVCTEETKFSPMQMEVINSYPTRKRAEEELVELIIRRIEERSKFAYATWNDENHEDFQSVVLNDESLCKAYGATWLTEYFDRPEQPMAMPDPMKAVVRDYLKHEIHGVGNYYVCVVGGDEEEYHFSVEENILEGS